MTMVKTIIVVSIVCLIFVCMSVVFLYYLNFGEIYQ